MAKKILLPLLALMLVLSVGFIACAKPAPTPAPAPAPKPAPELIKLKAVSFKASGTFIIDSYIKQIEKINERAKGQVVIEYVGGTEVVDMADQPEAVQKGVIDMTIMPGTRFAGLLPASRSLVVTSLTPAEERSGGYYDFMVEQFKTVNMFYMGRTTQSWFYLATNKKVAKPQELKGQKIRASSTYKPFVEALGASPVSMKSSEIYLALERGVVDGFIQPIDGLVDRSLYEVSDYLIDHYFYEGSNPAVVMNLDAWNKIPKQTQNLVMESFIDFENENFSVCEKVAVDSRQRAIDEGMEPIKFSEEDGKWFRDLAYSAYFEMMEEKVPPDVYAEMMKLLKK